jgi:hypothetical protein
VASDPNNAGLFITQIGASVPTAADYQFVFNSNWPSLQVAYATTVTTPYTNNETSLVIPHKLGFYPFTIAWLSINNKLLYSFFGAPANYTGGGSYSNTSYGVDKTNVYPKWQWNEDTNSLDPFGNKLDGSLTASVAIKCYNIDLTQDANYTAPKPAPAKFPYDPTAGIKVAKAGKDIRSTNLNDFILHSRAQSPALLSVQTQDTGVADPNISGNTLIEYVNPANYIAWFFGFQRVTTTGQDRYVATPIQPGGVDVTGSRVSGLNTFVLTVPSSPGGTMVVLRDPLFAAANVEVTY